MSDHTWGVPDEDDSPSDLDALSFGHHPRSEADDDRSGLDAFTVDESPSAATTDEAPPEGAESSGPLTFGVTNAAGTITAQATISGAIRQIELAPSMGSMTESDLARDIMATAHLANLQGRVIQRGLVQSLLMQQGFEADVAEQFIDNMVDLPTPAQFEAAESAATAEYLRHANTDRW